jgi:sigma-B regulation protein RsbU (phosphoserine phosphatase)
MPEAFQGASEELFNLHQQVARLQALLETSRQVHATIHLEEVFRTVLRIVVLELEMPGALITSPRLVFGEMPPEPWTGCIRFPFRDRKDEVLAELVVAPRPGAVLSLDEQDFLDGLILQASVAVENARYYERNMTWARLQQDLEAARQIQQSLLPKRMPDIPGCSIAVRSSACYEVGGDYVDIVGRPDGSYLMVVADVAGKGLASAMVGATFRSAFRATANTGLPLPELAASLNEQHYLEGAEAQRRYVTAIFLGLSADGKSLHIVNAGHNPGFLVLDGAVCEAAASGTPLGLVPGMRYTAEEYRFTAGSRVLLYTDGLTEVFRGDDEFGSERLRKALLSCTARDCDAMLNSLWQQIVEFSQGAPQQDDMTALAMMRCSPQRENADDY